MSLKTPGDSVGAIRSKTVSALAGVTLRQLAHWHKTDLLTASVVPGRKGVPRYYSWGDYLRIRAAAKLLDRGLPNRQLRPNVEYLKANEPGWYRLPLSPLGDSVVVFSERREPYVALHDNQLVDSTVLSQIIAELEAEGALGTLAEFGDAVSMNPHIYGGQPVISGTRIETSFVETISHHQSAEEIAKLYSLTTFKVRRAIEFQQRVA